MPATGLDPAAAVDILSDISRAGVRLWVEEGRLRYRAPEGRLKDEERHLLVQRRDEILAQVVEGQLLPLSLAQRRLWLLHQLFPDSSAYNVPEIYWIDGPLDAGALERSLGEIQKRHEILRTRFPSVLEQPSQVVHPFRGFVLPVADLQHLPEERRRAEAIRLARGEALSPFDLARGSAFRARLVRLSETCHVLAVVIHHIAFDAGSFPILYGEIEALYQAFSGGRPSPLEEPAGQYADFALGQHEALRGTELDEQLAFWKRHLAGSPPRIELPGERDGQRGSGPGATGQEVAVLGDELADGVRELARRQGVTLSITVLSAFCAVLSRTSGQSDLALGLLSSGRHRRELSSVLGFIVNTLVLRCDLSGDPGFDELLQRIARVSFETLSHRDLPFEKLVEHLRPERVAGRNPLYNVSFNAVDTADHVLGLDGLGIRPIAVRGQAREDLTLTLLETGDGLRLRAEHDLAVLDPTVIRRLLGHVENVLRGAVADPSRRLSRLPLLSPAERHQLLVETNATRVGVPRHESPRRRLFPELFAAQAERAPDRVAVVLGTRSLSYRELDRRARRLARHLGELGVGPGVPVGVALERSPELVVALLAVLAAGGAYVPLDPSHPRERLAFIMKDCGMTLLLTREGPEARLQGLPATHRLEFGGELSAVFGTQTPPGPAPAVDAEDLAYVIYTSGSTGRPKGVQISRRSLANLLLSVERRPGMTGGDVVLAVTTPSFDISVPELLLPLVVGARLVLASSEDATDPRRLGGLLARGVTTMQATPASWRMLLDADWRGSFGLRAVSTGEALPDDLAARLLPRVGELWNLYGPTETTVWSSLRRLATGDLLLPNADLGQPIANTRLAVLDRRLEPVPLGAAGDLAIGGVGLARGYFGAPALTAASFVPDPFAAVEAAGARLYRTGDQVRWRGDGRLEFLGRLDFQLKLRGFRIELGEIESRLLEHPEVGAAVVVAPRAAGGQVRLVAHVVLRGGPDRLPPRELLRFLGSRLPEYMVPSAVVVAESLPLTANGKVDRTALAAVEAPAARNAGFVAPSHPGEAKLAAIWREVLGAERVGRGDDFFELGGHSLLATQVISRVRRVFGVELPARTLFDERTLAELARRIEGAASSAGRPPLRSVPRPAEGTPLSFAQERLWFFDRMSPGSPAYNVPERFQLRGPLEPAALRFALEQVEERHEALRTTFRAAEDGPVQVIAPPSAWRRGRCVLPVVDLSGLPPDAADAAARRLAQDDAERPFDLGRGPLMRATLLRLAPEDHVLALTLHHVVTDGWSQRLLLRELAGFYRARLGGRDADLAPLPIQSADYAAWQRRWLTDESLEDHLAYWRQQLADLPPLLELPTDRRRPAIQSYQGAATSFRFPGSLRDALDALAHGHSGTLFVPLLAGFCVLLGRSAGQDLVAVGSPFAGRNHLETEGLVGCFVETLVLRGDLSGDPTFEQLTERLWTVFLDAHTYQDLPFEKLVESLQPERTLSYSPIFQAAFSAESARGLRLPQLEGLELRRLPLDFEIAKFDLELMLTEVADGLEGVLRYSTDLFDASTMARLVEHLRALLEDAAREPGRPVSELSMLSAGERHQLTHEWSFTDTTAPAADALLELFDVQARRRPAACAATFAGEWLSYGELDRRADLLAERLRGQGIGPESRVGLCLPRSLELLVALLGTFKAGAAVLPLDPAYPAARLAFLVADAAAGVVVVGDGAADRLAGLPVPLVRLERQSPASVRQDGRASRGADPASLAYVVHTSGSTGRPKGVMVSRQSLLVHCRDFLHRYDLRPEDRVLQFAGLAFDVAYEEILPTWLAGATLVLRDDELAVSVRGLHRFVERERITLANLPASYWHEWVAELGRGASRVPASLRLLVVGSESVLAERLPAWTAASAGVRWANAYGPSEATIGSAIFEPTLAGAPLPPGAGSAESVPIGRPTAGTRIFVLDRHLRPVPAGVAGELAIGGEGVSRGYLRQPARTAERFVPDPQAGELPASPPGARLYLTGDLARFLADGNLQFLSRADRQLKVRGFRIEPGEIEGALREHPEVGEAVVVLQPAGAEASPAPGLGGAETAPAQLEAALAALAALEPAERDRLLLEVEQTSEAEVAAALANRLAAAPEREGRTLIRRQRDFELRLEIARGDFIRPPQENQRQWILSRALDEMADDLEELDRVARRFVAGSRRRKMRSGLHQSQARYDESQLVIEGQQVMQDWERPLMEAMARTAAASQGDVLEVGFGMGISATFLQELGVRSHTIIECNDQVIERFERWRAGYPERDIRLARGRWQEVSGEVGPFDAVFFDTYPLDEDEFAEAVLRQITFAESFIPVAAACLRPGGVFTYYTNEIDSFSRRHQRLVLRHFKSLRLEVVKDLAPPPDCNYWWADSMVVVEATR